MIVKSTRQQGELSPSVGQKYVEDSAPVFFQTQLLNNTDYSYFLHHPAFPPASPISLSYTSSFPTGC